VIEKQVGIVLHSFREIVGAVAKMIEPATLARFQAYAAALKNQAVFEIPGMFEEILERAASGVAENGNTALVDRSA
jgi:hypothetical protein